MHIYLHPTFSHRTLTLHVNDSFFFIFFLISAVLRNEAEFIRRLGAVAETVVS